VSLNVRVTGDFKVCGLDKFCLRAEARVEEGHFAPWLVQNTGEDWRMR
jgi:hypothetical protein